MVGWTGVGVIVGEGLGSRVQHEVGGRGVAGLGEQEVLLGCWRGSRSGGAGSFWGSVSRSGVGCGGGGGGGVAGLV